MTERIIRTLAELNEQIAAGRVYNAFFTEAKAAFGYAIYQQRHGGTHNYGAVLNRYRHDPEFQGEARKGFDILEEATVPSSCHDMKSYFKTYSRACTAGLPEEIRTAMNAFIFDCLPLMEAVEAAKPLVVKGRRPSTEVSDAERRTLENTGTCPVCGRNIKRNDDGTITSHGYRVEGHEHAGGCYGTGYQPWELSYEGAVNYREILNFSLSHAMQEYEHATTEGYESVFCHRTRTWVSRGNNGYTTALESKIRELTSRVRQLTSDVLYFNERIQNWKPADLPGVLAGFSK